MSSSRNALVACGLAALALVAPAGLACTGAQAQSSIKIVVNGDPITTNEINQRARFLRLVARDLAGPQLVRQATDELVEERIKFQEAKRLKITANEAQVELAFGGIAQRVKLAPAQLAAALGQQGVDVGTLKTRLRAQIVWQQLVLNRFQRTVSIADSDVVTALEKQRQEASAKGKPGEATKTTTTEYALNQITFVVAKSTPGGLPGRTKEAEQFRSRAKGCAGLVEIAKAYKEVVIKNVGKRTEDELPPAYRSALAETPVGGTTKPQQGPLGVEMLAVCEKREIQADFVIRAKVEEDLREKEGQLLARQYLSELRRIAVIDEKK